MDEFLELYDKRPDKTNPCGIQINHAFAVFMVAKNVKPTAIIESGVNAGMSTYIFRAAAPNAKIISIDPEAKPICGQKERWVDTDGNTDYLVGDSFKDVAEIDWANYPGVNISTTLFYEDDHQNAFSRMHILQKQVQQWWLLHLTVGQKSSESTCMYKLWSI
jgi:hypothetical protein